ncbi:pyridoxal phosphate-dependent aminotransferase [Candidatus Kaiserbacteria bacterium]|nr:pyridoxal phosphate-dependent aminotransferase [Candidatus Kaiserbacteria bacterium]
MRLNIVHPGADKLRYEIREIADVARRVAEAGIPVVWENIGDPVCRGEVPPAWIKKIVVNAVKEDAVFAYSPTKGLDETRAYIARERNLEGGIRITPDDILFFNGLGDGISHLYRNLNPRARILGPDPAYPTHSSAEAAHADKPHITYKLDPENEWKPDLADMEKKIREHKEIAGILIVNPDNPTGFVYPQKTIRAIVALAKKYKLFIISDEIYSNLAYKGSGMKKLASVIDSVPGIAMRGISKEFPWPGARCGWIEFYNRDKDANFDKYARSIVDSKTLEVCSTTLPQRVLPKVMGDKRYYPYLAKRTRNYKRRADYAHKVLSKISGVIIHKPHGAFYMTCVFKKGVLNKNQTLPIKSSLKKYIESCLTNAPPDKRFVYYLLASTGVCVVPLSSGFNSRLHGFRFLLLEPNDAKFEKTITTIARAISDYLSS